ncbi:unnamed protein product [marine sediment metagenome]|uniref:Uncharacterized protein n=1 Tax=marine sediment metagenome TaxID=412755 RepID=X1KU83_9ZZZZ
MVRKPEKPKAGIYKATSKASGKSDVGLTCIGEVCFTDKGFKIVLAEDADPKCAKKTAELILSGNSNVVFEIPGKGIVKTADEIEEMISGDGEGT